ncbi:MAG: Smr/MutS family protein [Burkholderiaceae bacterium]|nr:Smr/MutS family protein [Burkholderiaceae bacterium]
MRATQFSDLKAMQKLLADQARAEKEAQAAARLAEQQRQREQQLFAFSIGAVKPIKDSGRVPAPPSQVTPRPLQRESDDSAVMAEALSDEFDVTSLLETDDALSYRRSGIGDDVLKKLRGGHWALQGQIDLHGLRTDEARSDLADFLRAAVRKGWRCVRVVHGKGLGSPGKTPILKAKTHRWLVKKKEVLAFVQARGCDGGAGALMVLLQGQQQGSHLTKK